MSSSRFSSTARSFADRALLSEPSASAGLKSNDLKNTSAAAGCAGSDSVFSVGARGVHLPDSYRCVTQRSNGGADVYPRDTCPGTKTHISTTVSSSPADTEETSTAVNVTGKDEVAALESSYLPRLPLRSQDAAPKKHLERASQRAHQVASGSMIEKGGSQRKSLHVFPKKKEDQKREERSLSREIPQEKPRLLYVLIIGPEGAEEKGRTQKATNAKRIRLLSQDAPPEPLVMTVRDPGKFSVLATATPNWNGRHCIEGKTWAGVPVKIATFSIHAAIFEDASGKRLAEATCIKCRHTLGSNKRTVCKHPRSGLDPNGVIKLRLRSHRPAHLFLVADLTVHASIPDPNEKPRVCPACIGAPPSAPSSALAVSKSTWAHLQYWEYVPASPRNSIFKPSPSTVSGKNGKPSNVRASACHVAAKGSRSTFSARIPVTPKVPAPDELKSSKSCSRPKVARVAPRQAEKAAQSKLRRKSSVLPSGSPRPILLSPTDPKPVPGGSAAEGRCSSYSKTTSVQARTLSLHSMTRGSDGASSVNKPVGSVLLSPAVAAAPRADRLNVQDMPADGSSEASGEPGKDALATVTRSVHGRESMPSFGPGGGNGNIAEKGRYGSATKPNAVVPSTVHVGSSAATTASSKGLGLAAKALVGKRLHSGTPASASSTITSKSSCTLDATALATIANVEPADAEGDRGGASGLPSHPESTLIKGIIGGVSEDCKCQVNCSCAVAVDDSGRAGGTDSDRMKCGDGSVVKPIAVSLPAQPTVNEKNGIMTDPIQTVNASRITIAALISTAQSSPSDNPAVPTNTGNTKPAGMEDATADACGSLAHPKIKLSETPRPANKAFPLLSIPSIGFYPVSAEHWASDGTHVSIGKTSKNNDYAIGSSGSEAAMEDATADACGTLAHPKIKLSETPRPANKAFPLLSIPSIGFYPVSAEHWASDGTHVSIGKTSKNNDCTIGSSGSEAVMEDATADACGTLAHPKIKLSETPRPANKAFPLLSIPSIGFYPVSAEHWASDGTHVSIGKTSKNNDCAIGSSGSEAVVADENVPGPAVMKKGDSVSKIGRLCDEWSGAKGSRENAKFVNKCKNGAKPSDQQGGEVAGEAGTSGGVGLKAGSPFRARSVAMTRTVEGSQIVDIQKVLALLSKAIRQGPNRQNLDTVFCNIRDALTHAEFYKSDRQNLVTVFCNLRNALTRAEFYKSDRQNLETVFSNLRDALTRTEFHKSVHPASLKLLCSDVNCGTMLTVFETVSPAPTAAVVTPASTNTLKGSDDGAQHFSDGAAPYPRHPSSLHKGGVSEPRVSYSPCGVADGADGTRPAKSSEEALPASQLGRRDEGGCSFSTNRQDAAEVEKASLKEAPSTPTPAGDDGEVINSIIEPEFRLFIDTWIVAIIEALTKNGPSSSSSVSKQAAVSDATSTALATPKQSRPLSDDFSVVQEASCLPQRTIDGVKDNGVLCGQPLAFVAGDSASGISVDDAATASGSATDGNKSNGPKTLGHLPGDSSLGVKQMRSDSPVLPFASHATFPSLPYAAPSSAPARAERDRCGGSDHLGTEKMTEVTATQLSKLPFPQPHLAATQGMEGPEPRDVGARKAAVESMTPWGGSTPCNVETLKVRDGMGGKQVERTDVAYGVDLVGTISGSATSLRGTKKSDASSVCLAVSQAHPPAAGGYIHPTESGGENAKSTTNKPLDEAFVAGGGRKRKGVEASEATAEVVKPQPLHPPAAKKGGGLTKEEAKLKQAILNAELLHLNFRWSEGRPRVGRKDDLLSRLYLAEGDPIIPSNTDRRAPTPGQPLPFDALFPDYEERLSGAKFERKEETSKSSGKVASASTLTTRSTELEHGVQPNKRMRHQP